MSTIYGDCSSTASQLFAQATARAEQRHIEQQNQLQQPLQIPLIQESAPAGEENKGVYIDVFV
jgi:hypothetical protein